MTHFLESRVLTEKKIDCLDSSSFPSEYHEGRKY